MDRLIYLFVVIVGALTLYQCSAVRINMQGSISLGQEVLETISHYMRSKSAVLTRRVMNPEKDESVKSTVQSANICQGVKICDGPLGEFIKEYVLILAGAVSSIFEGILNRKANKDANLVEYLKLILIEIHDLLKKTTSYITKSNDLQEWLGIVKKIAGKFQKNVASFVNDHMEGEDSEDIQVIKKKLLQKLIMGILLVENKYEIKLCKDHQICERMHEVTFALNGLLLDISNASNQKSMEFVKNFYENLPEQLFSFLGPDTMHEFQVILSDLGYTHSVSAKEVLSSVYETVNKRLKFLLEDAPFSKALDDQLVFGILSDMDYFYDSKKKSYSFDVFLGPFTAWLKLGGKLTPHMQIIINELNKKLQSQDPELVEKLTNEVRVFLELTIGNDIM